LGNQLKLWWRNGAETGLYVSYIALPEEKNSSLNMSAFIMGLIFVLGLLSISKKRKHNFAFAFWCFLQDYWFNGLNIDQDFFKKSLIILLSTIVMFAFVTLAHYSTNAPIQTLFFEWWESRWLCSGCHNGSDYLVVLLADSTQWQTL
jgi:cell shape-determining protein MreD